MVQFALNVHCSSVVLSEVYVMVITGLVEGISITYQGSGLGSNQNNSPKLLVEGSSDSLFQKSSATSNLYESVHMSFKVSCHPILRVRGYRSMGYEFVTYGSSVFSVIAFRVESWSVWGSTVCLGEVRIYDSLC
jgi:hypothetical protein